MSKGKPIKKYQDGLKENMVGFTTELTKVFPDLRITSGFRPRAFTKQGAVSRHALGEAIDIEGRKDVYDYLWNTKEGVSLLNRFNVGVLDETTPEMLEKTGGTGAHYHIGADSTLVPKAKQRYKELTGSDTPMTDYFVNPYMNQSNNISILPETEINTTFASTSLDYLKNEELKKQQENQTTEETDTEQYTPQENNFLQDLLANISLGVEYVKPVQRNIMQSGGKIIKDNNGYWNPKNWGKQVEISSPNITMQGVNQPLWGTSKETGETKLMMPEEDYYFQNTKNVIETPTYQQGGKKKPIYVDDKNDPRYRAYQDSLLLHNLSEKQRLKGTNNKENIIFNNKGSDVLDERERKWYQDTRKKLKGKFFPNSEVSIMIQGNDDRKNPKSKQNDYNNDEYFHPDIKPVKGYNWSTEKGLTRLLESNDNFLYKKPTQPVEVRPNIYTDKQGNTFTTGDSKLTGQPQLVKRISKVEPVLQPKQTAVEIQPQRETKLNIPTQEIDTRRPIEMPKSFNISSQRTNMLGVNDFYNYNKQGATYEEALKAKETADAYNNSIQQKYGNSEALQNPKAVERLKQLRQEVNITPQYQQGGEYSENENKFLAELKKLKLI